MTTYYFNLLTQEGVICDPEGTDLADFSSAWEHARGVACELMRDNELRTRSWRLDVCDSSGRVCFHLLFAAVDETLDELPPELRNSIERCCTAAASLNETIHASRLTLFETKALLAHSEGRPYLAAINGLKVA
jgi:hypothetical protein